jgi:hypothetical protein
LSCFNLFTNLGYGIIISLQTHVRKGGNLKMEEQEKKLSWAGFVETTAVNFFVECSIEKMSIEDGKGNKAKLTRQKDNGIKVEYTSITTL